MQITARISKLCYGLDPAKVQPVLVAQKVRRETETATAAATERYSRAQAQAHREQ